MSLLQSIKAWWDDHKPRKLSELMVVECDDEVVKVRVLARLDPGFNQEFRWDDVTRVCFKDEGISSSDIVYLELKDRTKPAVVLMEAGGGPEFFSKVVGRGLLPEALWKKAMGSSNGGMYCWPPKDQAGA